LDVAGVGVTVVVMHASVVDAGEFVGVGWVDEMEEDGVVDFLW
jgi:hypothetical protein